MNTFASNSNLKTRLQLASPLAFAITAATTSLLANSISHAGNAVAGIAAKSGAVSAMRDGSFKTYVVDSFSADSLTQVISPLLPAGGSVSSYQNKLIIRTTADNFHQISQVLGQIDTLPKALNVSLRIKESNESERLDAGGRVVIYGDGSDVRVGGGVSVFSNSSNQQNNSLYQVRALSGYPARIDSGTLLALSNGIWGQTLVPVTTGVEVVPQMLPNGQVRLQVNQQYNRSLSGLGVQTQSAQTEVVTSLGQWVSVGNIVQQKQAQGSFGSHAASYVQLPLQIKVDVAP